MHESVDRRGEEASSIGRKNDARDILAMSKKCMCLSALFRIPDNDLAAGSPQEHYITFRMSSEASDNLTDTPELSGSLPNALCFRNLLPLDCAI